MSNDSRRREWINDITQRQKDIVFPDTAGNEARFWRNLIHGKTPLRPVQKIGVGIFVGMVLLPLVGMIISVGWDSETHHFRTGDLEILFLGLALAAAFLWGFLWLFSFTNRRSGPS